MNNKSITIKGVEVSHPDKILFPQAKINKEDIAKYYVKIADIILPYLKDRPLTLKRYPDGINKEGFYQKKIAGYFPDYIHNISLKNRSKKGSTRYPLCQNIKSLVYFTQLGGITLHRWLSRQDKPDKPDMMVFDLDPSSDNDFRSVIETAKILKDLIEEKGLSAYVMTTGSRGMHVVAPLRRKHSFDTVRKEANKIANAAVSHNPEALTTEIHKDKRKGKLFLDIARNAYGQTSVTPYSVRARHNAPVATPLDWEELDRKGLQSDSYSVWTIPRRLAQKSDPWKHFLKSSAEL